MKIQTTFKNSVPGKEWWDGLEKCYPELNQEKKLGSIHMQILNPTVCNKYLSDLTEILNTHGIKGKLGRILSMDEIGKRFKLTPVKVVSEKGI